MQTSTTKDLHLEAVSVSLKAAQKIALFLCSRPVPVALLPKNESVEGCSEVHNVSNDWGFVTSNRKI